MLKPAVPDGHVYSPVIDPAELRAAQARIWRRHPDDPPGIEFREAEQRQLLRSVADLAPDYDYASRPSSSDARAPVHRFLPRRQDRQR